MTIFNIFSANYLIPCSFSFLVCSNGHYGPDCKIPCNCRSQCSSITGQCAGPCAFGWKQGTHGVCNVTGGAGLMWNFCLFMIYFYELVDGWSNEYIRLSDASNQALAL